jgi:hypothetical protein
VGSKKGNYVLTNAASINRIYEYITPIKQLPQGDYAPIIQLVAPTKNSSCYFFRKVHPSEKTAVDFEIAVSNNDANLLLMIQTIKE